MSLDQRCAGAILTSKEPIVEVLDIVNENRYTPLEVYLILFPEKLGVIEKIKITDEIIHTRYW